MGVVVRARIALQDLDIKLAHVEHWAGSINPHIRKTSILLGQITLPYLLAGKIKGRQVARREQAEDPLPVGRRRRRCHIVSALLEVSSGRHPSPERLAGLSIQAKQEQILLLVRTDRKNLV